MSDSYKFVSGNINKFNANGFSEFEVTVQGVIDAGYTLVGSIFMINDSIAAQAYTFIDAPIAVITVDATKDTVKQFFGSNISEVTIGATVTEGAVISYALQEGTILPQGLSFNTSTGKLTGNPNAGNTAVGTELAGNIVVVVSATKGAESKTCTIPFSFIAKPTITAEVSQTINAEEGSIPEGSKIIATANFGILTYAVKAGETLPEGISLDQSTGVLSGTVSNNYNINFIITDTTVNGLTETKEIEVRINNMM